MKAWVMRVMALLILIAAPVRAQRGEPAKPLFSAALADVPGKNLVVVELNIPPHPGPASTLEQHARGHHHPGSVYVYVTQGTLRIAVEGQPVRVLKTGESFFEPVGAHHIITESASATEPARAIAVMIVPEGAPLATPDVEK
jgi:quercetin dioxygenase-like cupin family protein